MSQDDCESNACGDLLREFLLYEVHVICLTIYMLHLCLVAPRWSPRHKIMSHCGSNHCLFPHFFFLSPIEEWRVETACEGEDCMRRLHAYTSQTYVHFQREH